MGRDLPPAPPPRPARPAVAADQAGPEAAFNRSYVGSRPDLVARLPQSCRNVLDLGCATGAVGLALKARHERTRVVGIELDPAMAAVAGGRIDRVVVGDLCSPAVMEELTGERFDGVVAGDILEHVTDPWWVLRALGPFLAPGAVIVASIPNIGFWDTWWNVLIRRRWPYRPRGIHDATHLRFFARHNVEHLFEQAGLEIVRLDRTYRLREAGSRRDRYARYLALPGLRELVTFQFLVVARWPPAPSPLPRELAADRRELAPPG
jgi:SAM-dependent methyltransferase